MRRDDGRSVGSRWSRQPRWLRAGMGGVVAAVVMGSLFLLMTGSVGIAAVFAALAGGGWALLTRR